MFQRQWNCAELREEKVIYSLTDNMQIPELGFGCHRVYLTHVSALVLLLHVCNVQKPGFVLIVLVMCHGDSRVPRNYMIMHSQYCRLLEVHPRHLQLSQEDQIDISANAVPTEDAVEGTLLHPRGEREGVSGKLGSEFRSKEDFLEIAYQNHLPAQ